MLSFRHTKHTSKNVADTNFKLFLENRVIVIKNLTPIDRWHYVSAKEIVAGIITRFNSIDLVNNSMWWKEPKFLYNYFEESSHDGTLMTGKMLISLI